MKPEWMHSVVGCLAATGVGSTLPVFAVLFGEVFGVSTLRKYFSVCLIIHIHYVANTNTLNIPAPGIPQVFIISACQTSQ